MNQTAWRPVLQAPLWLKLLKRRHPPALRSRPRSVQTYLMCLLLTSLQCSGAMPQGKMAKSLDRSRLSVMSYNIWNFNSLEDYGEGYEPRIWRLGKVRLGRRVENDIAVLQVLRDEKAAVDSACYWNDCLTNCFCCFVLLLFSQLGHILSCFSM